MKDVNNKKVGILTLQGYFNYGNRLQAYALQRTLTDLGVQPCHLLIRKKYAGLRWIKRNILTVLNINNSRKNSEILKQKRKKIYPFSADYIHEARLRNENEYDFFIVGSDQVWKPSSIRREIGDYFLSFAPERKRVAYGASFGVEQIQPEYQTKYAKYLTEMRHVSVREHVGARIVKELTGRDAQVVLDPTLLLSAKDWSVLTADEDRKLINNRYVVVYALGQLSSEMEKSIKKYCRKNKCDAYRIMGDDASSSGDKIPSVPEFLARIKNAQVVFTDSFHACVFSIIFHTPFVALRRPGKDMTSRLKTLLALVHLDDNLVDDASVVERVIGKTRFDEADKRIAKARKKSLSFLYDALEIKVSQKRIAQGNKGE